MNRKLNAAWLLLVLAPVGLMGWLGLRSVRLEQTQMQARVEAAGLRLLGQYDAALQDVILRVEQELWLLLAESFDGDDAQRRLVRASRYVRQPFAFDADGLLLVPDAGRGDLVARAQYFLERTAAWRRSGNVLASVHGEQAQLPERDNGWYTWFWDDGVEFVFWRRMADGGVHGVNLDRYALLAELIAALPDGNNGMAEYGSYSGAGVLDDYIMLRDARGGTLYAWGAAVPGEGGAPLVVRSLSEPLSAWQLCYFGSEAEAVGMSPAVWGLWLLVVAVIVVMLVAAFLIVREQGRTMREAQQRVSFVNQVSHELKTPLTNIRMYTELLEQRLAGADAKSRQYLAVLSSESQRLARMIHNVLTFGKQGRGLLRIHRTAGILDETVRTVLEHFEPVLDRRAMQVHFEAGCADAVLYDRDALEQILGNLLGNAEKYAGEGASIKVKTWREDGVVMVEVADNGPGIPAAYRDEIFKPFFRLDDRLTQQASGAGIGLSISRDLARLHGGDLVLVPGDKGACFMLKLSI